MKQWEIDLDALARTIDDEAKPLGVSGEHQRTTAIARVLLAEVRRLRSEINTPEVNDFVEGVVREAAHQRERWGYEHDAAKGPAEWFWAVGYVLGKAQFLADTAKRRHHLITAAAITLNWHLYVSGKVPGREKPEG